MNKVIIAAGIAWMAIACGTTKKEQPEKGEASSTAAETPEVKVTAGQGVLNPNLASRDQLLSIPQIDEEKADQIIAGRPYLKTTDFTGMLRKIFPEEVVSDVNTALFLPINLNTAAEETFLEVPGVGDKMAHEFEEYRPYQSIEQFRREIGKYVDENEVARYEQYVFVPVNLNTGSKEEIMTIPGMGEKMLHEFEEYRPYQNMGQFRREIGKYVDDDELARLERYVTLD